MISVNLSTLSDFGMTSLLDISFSSLIFFFHSGSLMRNCRACWVLSVITVVPESDLAAPKDCKNISVHDNFGNRNIS